MRSSTREIMRQINGTGAVPDRAGRARTALRALRGPACVLLSLLSLPALAAAIPAQPASWTVVNTDVPLVEDGALLVRFYRGDFGNATTDGLMITVTDASSATSPGSVELLELSADPPYAVFHFDAPLGVDRTLYHAGTSANVVYNGGLFMTTSAFDGALPSANPTATLEITHSTVQQMCCAMTFAISPIGPVAPPCLVTRAKELPSVWIDLGLEPSDSVARQYLYRAALTSPELREGSWLPATNAGFAAAIASNVEADEYCYRVEAYRITDGEQVTLAEGCLPHDLGTLGEVGPDENAILAALDVRSCGVPPIDLLQPWCDVNRAACSDPMSPSNFACMQATFDTQCQDHPASDEDLVTQVEDVIDGGGGSGSGGGGGNGAGSGGMAASGSGGTGAGDDGSAGASNTAGAGATAGVGSAGMSGLDDEARAGGMAEGCGSNESESRGGCRQSDGDGGSCSAALHEQGPPPALASALGLFALGLLVARRRTRRAHAQAGSLRSS